MTKDQVFPEGHIAPGTLIANTDTKHYQHLVDKIYRQHSMNIYFFYYFFYYIDNLQVHSSLYHEE